MIGVALFAAILCGLGSSVMQELASSQRTSFTDQIAFAKRVDTRCSTLSGEKQRACQRQAPDAGGVAAFGIETDQLGARARALQTIGGSITWAQTWLLTLLGISALLVGITVTNSVDLEKRRLTAGWHPTRASVNPFLAAAGAGLSAGMIVVLGAIVGSLTAMVVGGVVWPLGGEPSDALIRGLGDVALATPSFGGLIAILGVVAVLILVSWFAARTIATLLIGASLFGGLALFSSALPVWVPGAALPAAAGMWFHHRGEIVHLWQWPVQPLDRGFPLIDWTALASADPRGAATVGAVVLLILAAAAVPLAVKRPLR